MNGRALVGFTLGLVLVSASPALAQRGRGRGDAQASRYGWLGSLEAGKAEARRTGKPLMVVVRCVP
jgi:hypothetical protein